MIQPTSRLFPLVLASLLGMGCGTNGGNGFSSGTPDDDDSSADDDDDDFVQADRSAYLEFNRSSAFGESEAGTGLFSSWFNPTDFEPRIPLPPKINTCRAGQHPAGTHGVPPTQHDIGIPSVTTPNGSVLELTLDGDFWFGDTGSNDWESHQEYDIAISGGADREAATYLGALVTPSVLTLTSLEVSETGLDLEWYGGNNNGHVELRLVFTTELPDQVQTYVVCRLFDDGEATIAPEDLESLAGMEVQLELIRTATANFETDKGAPGVASGISSAFSMLDLPAAPE